MIPTILDVAGMFDGMAFTGEQAVATAHAVTDTYNKGSKVTLNFYGVKFFTTLYFSALFHYLPNNIFEDTNFIGLSDAGQTAYKTASIGTAMTDAGRAKRQKILAELLGA